MSRRPSPGLIYRHDLRKFAVLLGLMVTVVALLIAREFVIY